MKKLFFILLSALSLTAFAQQKKVAVYVTGQQSGINKVLGDQLVAAFAKSGKYIAIERTASFLSELSKEQNYQRTGAVDDNELSRLGKQFGVQLVCVADVSEVFGEKYISCRLIDVESAEVANTSSANSKLDSMQELLTVTDKLAKELTAKTVQEKAVELAAMQKANEETEKMLSEAFIKGYVTIGNLNVATSASAVTWNQVSAIAEECRIGGFTGWRVPTASEFNMIQSVFYSYSADKNNREKYPHLTATDLAKFEHLVNRSKDFWVSNGYVTDGNRYFHESKANSVWYLLLVCDVK